MTAAKLLGDLYRAGVVLSANGDRLAFDAPAGVMTPQLLAILKARKPELLAVLQGDYLHAAAARLSRIVDTDERQALVEAFEERAGICEFDCNISRGDAERHAYIEMARTLEKDRR